MLFSNAAVYLVENDVEESDARTLRQLKFFV
jgi:hypothetical protein